MKTAIINLILSVTLLLANLIVQASRSQINPNSETKLEAIYNLFFRGNLILPLLVVYALLSALYFKRMKRRRG